MLNQKENKPTIGFGLDYVNVSNRTDLNFSDNGKDILMPMLSISIPIFNTTYKSKNQTERITTTRIFSTKTRSFKCIRSTFR